MDSEMYLGDLYRVVRSPEEQTKFAASGWKDVKDPSVKAYRPYTAAETAAEPPAATDETPKKPAPKNGNGKKD